MMNFSWSASRCRTFVLGVLVYLTACVPGTVSSAQTPAATTETHAKGDITGSWQGTIHAGRDLRQVLQITKGDKGFTGKMFSIDQSSPGIAVPSITLDGSAVKFSVDVIGGSFAGTLSADGNSIVGTWSQGQDLPVTLVRATKETAWEIPAPPPPPKMMDASADLSFDVATIKPNDSGATSPQGLNIGPHQFRTRATSLMDLVSFAYAMQSKQLIGAPDWVFKDRYDIEAKFDEDGLPSTDQARSAVRKLLTERFKFTVHKDKRDLSAYVLTVAKSGLKIKESEQAIGPGFGFRPKAGGLTIPVRAATMTDFGNFLQMIVLDRPVVNRTELTKRYDFMLTFTPDDSQFNGHPPPMPAKTDATETAPSLFEAMQNDLGLKLEAQKTDVDVIVVDHVEKPSAN